MKPRNRIGKTKNTEGEEIRMACIYRQKTKQKTIPSVYMGEHIFNMHAFKKKRAVHGEKGADAKKGHSVSKCSTCHVSVYVHLSFPQKNPKQHPDFSSTNAIRPRLRGRQTGVLSLLARLTDWWLTRPWFSGNSVVLSPNRVY